MSLCLSEIKGNVKWTLSFPFLLALLLMLDDLWVAGLLYFWGSIYPYQLYTRNFCQIENNIVPSQSYCILKFRKNIVHLNLNGNSPKLKLQNLSPPTVKNWKFQNSIFPLLGPKSKIWLGLNVLHWSLKHNYKVSRLYLKTMEIDFEVNFLGIVMKVCTCNIIECILIFTNVITLD